MIKEMKRENKGERRGYFYGHKYDLVKDAVDELDYMTKSSKEIYRAEHKENQVRRSNVLKKRRLTMRRYRSTANYIKMIKAQLSQPLDPEKQQELYNMLSILELKASRDYKLFLDKLDDQLEILNVVNWNTVADFD
jgi:hypothetical protein